MRPLTAHNNGTTTMQTTTTISTKPEAGAESVKTEITFNWDGVSPEEIQAIAQRALVVKVQGGYRKNGIPATDTVNVSDHKPGVRAPRAKADPIALLMALPAAEREAALRAAGLIA